jgi:hypothetical protein
MDGNAARKNEPGPWLYILRSDFARRWIWESPDQWGDQQKRETTYQSSARLAIFDLPLGNPLRHLRMLTISPMGCNIISSQPVRHLQYRPRHTNKASPQVYRCIL